MEDKERELLLKELQQLIEGYNEIINRWDELPEEVQKRLEYTAGKYMELSKIISKGYNSEDLTDSECNLFLELRNCFEENSEIIDQYLKPPDVL